MRQMRLERAHIAVGFRSDWTRLPLLTENVSAFGSNADRSTDRCGGCGIARTHCDNRITARVCIPRVESIERKVGGKCSGGRVPWPRTSYGTGMDLGGSAEDYTTLPNRNWAGIERIGTRNK